MQCKFALVVPPPSQSAAKIAKCDLRSLRQRAVVLYHTCSAMQSVVLQCSLHAVVCIQGTLLVVLYNVYCVLKKNLCCIMYSVYCVLCTVYCVLKNLGEGKLGKIKCAAVSECCLVCGGVQ